MTILNLCNRDANVDVDGIAAAVTPMPGGTGPMTVACLLENTMKAAELQGIIPKDKQIY